MPEAAARLARMVSTTDTRRNVLGTLATALAGLSIAGTAAASEASREQHHRPATHRTGTRQQHAIDAEGRSSDTAAVAPSAGRYEWYSATVDRIVDGHHVVILLEADGRVFEQVVVDRSELPTAKERDEFLVLMDGDELAAAVRL